MQIDRFWESREYNSLEHCAIDMADAGITATGFISGTYRNEIFRTTYRIVTNPNWETLSASVNHLYQDHEQLIELRSDSLGQWHLNGVLAEHLNGCVDVDLPLTPFTNSLPINRLRPKLHAEHQIKVVYIDVLQGQITALHQKYCHKADQLYHYQNVPNDFEADIRVDEVGLVTHYPDLFKSVGAFQ